MLKGQGRESICVCMYIYIYRGINKRSNTNKSMGLYVCVYIYMCILVQFRGIRNSHGTHKNLCKPRAVTSRSAA